MSRNLLTSGAIFTSMGFFLAGCSSLDLFGGGGGDDDVAAVASTSTATPVVAETPPVEEPVAETPVVAETPPAVDPTPPTSTIATPSPVSTSDPVTFSGPAFIVTRAADGTVATNQAATLTIREGDQTFQEVTLEQAQSAVAQNGDLQEAFDNNVFASQTSTPTIFLTIQEGSGTLSDGSNVIDSLTPTSAQIVVTNGCTPGPDSCVPLRTFSEGQFSDFVVVDANGNNVDIPSLIDGTITNVDGLTLFQSAVGRVSGLTFGSFARYLSTTAQLTAAPENGEPGLENVVGVEAYGFGGAATPESVVQQRAANSVRATYNSGSFEGVVTTVDGSEDGLSGSPSLTADFAAGTVNGTIQLRNDADFDIGIQTSITGNTFNGTARFLTENDGVASGAGVAQGGFFGPNAEEIAGIVQVQGQAPNTPNGTVTTVTGGFAARQTSQN